MECLTQKSEIKNIVSNIRSFSFYEKKEPLVDETKVNLFLDAVNDLKKSLADKTRRVYNINEKIEQLTWLNDLDEECLMLVNDLVSVAKDLHSTLIRQYLILSFFRKKGIAKTEIEDFKNSVDELKESYEDLESVFFFLPEFPDFVETTKQLSLV